MYSLEIVQNRTVIILYMNVLCVSQIQEFVMLSHNLSGITAHVTMYNQTVTYTYINPTNLNC
jgi:hypothetical protein